MAAVIGLFGKSILIGRLSILAFQTTAFALGMSVSGDYLLVGIAAVIWSVVRSFYLANMVLYSSFTGAAIILIFILIVAILQQRITPDWKHWLFIGIFSLLAILSDPLTIYAVGIALIFLISKKPMGGIYVSLVIGAGLLMYGGYLYFSGNFQAFWNNAIIFNSDVYAKYAYANPIRIGDFLNMVIKGLGITDNFWFNFNPLTRITTGSSLLDKWVFTGFNYRFSIILTSVFLALRKQFRAATFTYTFAASTLIIEKWGFHAQPFIVVSLIGISALITHEWWQGTGHKLLKTAEIVVGFTVLLLTCWLGVRLMDNIYTLRNTYGERQVAGFKNDALTIKELTCDLPNVLLGYYPAGSYWYWFTGMKPVSKYVYLWPWVADVGLDDILNQLGQDQELAIVVRQDVIVWNTYDSKQYLHQLDVFLEMNYHKISDKMYISPELYSRCPK